MSFKMKISLLKISSLMGDILAVREFSILIARRSKKKQEKARKKKY